MIAHAVSSKQSLGNSTDPSEKNHPGSVQNAITLTIQGVNFCLIPSDNATDQCGTNNVDSNVNTGTSTCASSALLSFTNGQSTTIRLQSFTGTLKIYTSEEGNAITSVPNNSNIPVPVTDSQNHGKVNVVSARKVEDEPTTPNSYSNGNGSTLEQGQQQLSFKRVSENKRGVSALQ
jgi:hypothetical protein